MKTCESCRFRDELRCAPLRDPNVATSTKWIIVEHIDARAEGKIEDCLVWEQGDIEAAAEE